MATNPSRHNLYLPICKLIYSTRNRVRSKNEHQPTLVPSADSTIEALQPIKDLIHTITADNGKEFAKHQEIAKELQISFYFCKPYHSWERGANENTNWLIRQYIPKGTDFSGITDEFVSWVENKLNNRPSKRLGYLTPNEKFNSILTN